MAPMRAGSGCHRMVRVTPTGASEPAMASLRVLSVVSDCIGWIVASSQRVQLGQGDPRAHPHGPLWGAQAGVFGWHGACQ